MKKLLITGASGFLGSHILRALIDNTKYNIIVLKRSFSDIWRIKSLIKNKRITFIDVDKIKLEDINWSNIKAIIHCATEYGRHDKSCYKILETNLMFPINLIECAIKHGVEIFINTDSFFNKERGSYSNLLNYSLSKKSLNLWLKHFSKNIKIVNLMLEHIYGENDSKDKFVESMIQNIAITPKNEINLTAGDQKRDFIYVGDVCKAYLAVLEFAQKYNFRYKHIEVGTGKAISLREFVNEIKFISNSQTKLNFGAIPYREDEIMCSFADVTELSNIVNINKFLTPKEGLRKIISKYKKEQLCL